MRLLCLAILAGCTGSAPSVREPAALVVSGRGLAGETAPPPAWVSYWSPATARARGFAVGTHGDRFAVAEPCGPGFFLQLTAEPLDLDLDDHRRALSASALAVLLRDPDRIGSFLTRVATRRSTVGQGYLEPSG